MQERDVLPFCNSGNEQVGKANGPDPATVCFWRRAASRENVSRVGADYPEERLAREPAPPYSGEGGFALWHYSEDPSLSRFRPRAPSGEPDGTPLVWAVDTRHAPMFWFPRDCPRGCIWPVSTTTAEDVERFFGQSAVSRVHVIEANWLARMQVCELYAYQMPTASFRPHQVGGYWVSEEHIDAIDRIAIDDLLGRHAAAHIELRITPSIWPFWQRVVSSTVEYSGSRLRNAGPHPDQLQPQLAPCTLGGVSK
jgi:hypothetical protein